MRAALSWRTPAALNRGIADAAGMSGSTRPERALHHDFNVVGVREQVDGLNGFDAVACRQTLEVARQSGRIAGDIDQARRTELEKMIGDLRDPATRWINDDDIEMRRVAPPP